MSRFTGPQAPGAMARYRTKKRADATERNARTLPHKRAAYWRELDSARAASDGPCAFPWKHAFPNWDSAIATLRRLPKYRRGQGLHPYPCDGHWHLGRDLARATVAWKSAA